MIIANGTFSLFPASVYLRSHFGENGDNNIRHSTQKIHFEMSNQKRALYYKQTFFENRLFIVFLIFMKIWYRTHLYSCLRQVYFHSNLFPRINIWVMCFLESSFQLFQLGRCKCRSYTSLFSFLCQHWFVSVYFVWKPRWKGLECSNLLYIVYTL